MNRFKRFALVMAIALIGVTMLFAQGAAEALEAQKDIVVLYTNDVHCAIDSNIGYAGLAKYKAEMEKDNFVVLVDAGDAIQGDTIGTVSKGEYLVDIMNEVGYDFCVLGNHEFDYGTDVLASLLKKANAQYLNATIEYTGNGNNLLKDTVPYVIERFGFLDVAFIGVSTPESITKSTPRYFMEDGQFVYDFAAGEDLYAAVQGYVDEVREKGADVVVVISHLGVEEGSEPNRATDLIANTTGIDALIDGHSHTTEPSMLVADKSGRKVLYTQTGTKLNNIGKLTISKDGSVKAELVAEAEKDEAVTAFIEDIKAQYESLVNTVVAHTEVELSITDENGVRAVRNRETAIGDLCADAYRAVADTDIAFVNGGGIRATIKKGDITTANMISVHPYGNALCSCYATGAEILDALEHSVVNTAATAASDGKAVGESGGFLQVSGIKFTIDTSIPSSVKKDDKGLFVAVEGERRVKDVFVEENGEWVPIDPEKTYTVACHNYLLQDMGDGYTMFTDNVYILDKVLIDNQVIINYICDFLGGNVGTEYAEPQGRITVI
ncbi:MAG: bifunctional UDP-sugar hydrolase/5'-nucleotidase [Candidatus Ornithospirochaeta sp.]|nr:bifunctional UDP-sugar hydrolase/5'-nucleotidase [Sphaerochaetaceae bacterium]MDY5524471.1 bifunctional UDP-sugar hydrolase/5'-nucleotidase [Candidatus Ornithospirochaeta sp.]